MIGVNFPAGIDRPLGIGEIVDRSVTLTVQRWRTLLLLVLVEAVPVGIARVTVPDHPAPLMLVWFVPDVLLAALLYGAVAFTTASVFAPPAMSVLRASARRFWPVMGAMLLSWLFLSLIALAILLTAAFIGVIAAAFTQNRIMLPVLGLGVMALGLFVFLPRNGLVAMIVVPIVALEDVSPWKGLMTAFRRVGHLGLVRGWLLGLAAFALTLGPALAISFAMDTVVAATKLRALTAVEEFIVDSVTLGFGMVVATVVALEMRVRFEGSDIEAAAAAPENS